MRTVFFLFLVGIIADVYSDDIIVSATRYESSKEKTTSSIFKVDVSKFQAKKSTTVGEILESVPQVYLNKSGSGGMQTIHLRGSETSHVLVVLDGLPLNDPINTSKLFDFSKITLIGIESIEVLFGSHGVLYGSEAIGGVVYIKSLNPKKTMAKISLSRGSYQTINQRALLGTKKGKLNGFIGIERVSTNGFNSTQQTSKNPAEPDGFELLNLTSKLGFDHSFFDISYLSRFHTKETDLEKGFGSERDDKNYTSDDRFHYHLITVKTKTDSQYFAPELKLGYSDQKRTNLDLPDNLGSSTDTQLYRAKSTDLNISNNFYISDSQTLITGVHYKNEKGVFDLNLSNFSTIFTDKSEDTYALYLHHHFELSENTVFNSGFRAEKSHLFGTNSSFKLGTSTRLSGSSRLYTLISTGYKNPTLYQLHSQYGNTKLDPEKALSIEMGSESSIEGIDFNFNTNYTVIDDFIDLEGNFPNQVYQNSNKLNIFSVGTDVNYKLTNSFKVESSLVYIRAKNKTDGSTLLNRPKWAGKIKSEYTQDKHSGALIFDAKGKRIGGSTSSPLPLSGYGLFHLGYEYNWQNFEFFSNINNLLNKDYVNTSGFNTGGRIIVVGLNAEY
jgi:vitamin B12 transporter